VASADAVRLLERVRRDKLGRSWRRNAGVLDQRCGSSRPSIRSSLDSSRRVLTPAALLVFIRPASRDDQRRDQPPVSLQAHPPGWRNWQTRGA
jgi:hypothetical protein